MTRCPSGAHRAIDCETMDECRENVALQDRGIIPRYRGRLLPPEVRP